jgi:hypothetical protein
LIHFCDDVSASCEVEGVGDSVVHRDAAVCGIGWGR